MDFTSGFLSHVSAGDITLGSTSDTGRMDVGAGMWGEAVTLLNGSGTIDIDGAQSAGANDFTAISNTGNIQLGSSGATVTSTATGNAIVLAAGGNFINNSGSKSPLSAKNGRWIVYSTSPTHDTNGAIVMLPPQVIYSKTYGTEPPGSIPNPGENTWVFSSSASGQVNSNNVVVNSVNTPNVTTTHSGTNGFNPGTFNDPVIPNIAGNSIPGNLVADASDGGDNGDSGDNPIADAINQANIRLAQVPSDTLGNSFTPHTPSNLLSFSTSSGLPGLSPASGSGEGGLDWAALLVSPDSNSGFGNVIHVTPVAGVLASNGLMLSGGGSGGGMLVDCMTPSGGSINDVHNPDPRCGTQAGGGPVMTYLRQQFESLEEPFTDPEKVKHIIIPGAVAMSILSIGYMLFFSRALYVALASFGIRTGWQKLDPASLLEYWESEHISSDHAEKQIANLFAS